MSNPDFDLWSSDLDAEVLRPPLFDRLGVDNVPTQVYPVWLVDVGAEARLHRPADDEEVFPTGSTIKVRMRGAQQWPNPLVMVNLAT